MKTVTAFISNFDVVTFINVIGPLTIALAALIMVIQRDYHAMLCALVILPILVLGALYMHTGQFIYILLVAFYTISMYLFDFGDNRRR